MYYPVVSPGHLSLLGSQTVILSQTLGTQQCIVSLLILKINLDVPLKISNNNGTTFSEV